jgi:CAAX protease family protein
VKREPLVLAFALVFPTIMAWLYFVDFNAAANVDSTPNVLMQILYVAGKVVQFGIPIIWLWISNRRTPHTSWLSNATEQLDRESMVRSRAYGIRLGFWFGLAVAAMVFAIFTGTLREDVLQPHDLFFGVPGEIRAKLTQLGLLSPLRYVALGAFLAVINSFLEEYYWRWFLFGRLRKFIPVGVAVIVSSLGFTGHHIIVLNVYFPGRFVGTTLWFSLAIAVGGAVWAWTYHKSNSLAGPWLSHFIVDAAILAFGYHLAFRQ